MVTAYRRVNRDSAPRSALDLDLSERNRCPLCGRHIFLEPLARAGVVRQVNADGKLHRWTCKGEKKN